MKQLWFAMSLMAGSLFFSANASADVSSGALLQQMNLASQSLNYELAFISINKQGVESLRYRHARLDNQPLAQLLQMDGPRREVVQRGNEISYFERALSRLRSMVTTSLIPCHRSFTPILNVSPLL